MTFEDSAPALAAAIKGAIELDGPLKERLSLVAEAVQRYRPHQADAVSRLVTRLTSHHAGGLAPAVGERLPGFVLPDETGKVTRLGELLAAGPLVVSLQRGHWCPYCRLSSVGVAAAQDAIFGLGGHIVAIVPEHARFSRLMKETAGARFPFLTDAANGYALSLNLAIWIGLEMEEILAEAGIDLPRYQGNQAWMLPIPATFVLDRKGIIVARHVDPDHRLRMEVDEIVEAVRRAR